MVCYGWDQVAAAYMTAAKEDNLRDTDDLKRHWVKTLCNGMKKPTGGTGEKGERIHKCIVIERLILDKTHSGILGLSPDEDEDRLHPLRPPLLRVKPKKMRIMNCLRSN